MDFFKNPDSELFSRWYQAAAFQPFFRTHSHIDTKRREPWLFDEPTLLLIREAIRTRYSFLPLWYTLFFEHEQDGAPVMRPLWVEYPSEVATFALDDEYLLGDRLLVHPVTQPGVSDVSVYFPGTQDIWYDINTYRKVQGGGTVKIAVTMSKIPVFQRGGTIIPKKERIRRSSALTHNDPYTLIVALDRNGSASGTLYMDDGQSFDYREKKYLYLSLEFKGNKLSSRYIDTARYPTRSWLERVVILGLPPGITRAQAESKSAGRVTLETTYNTETQSLIVRKPAVSMAEEWTIVLQ